ncbi:MAG: hypothetical protein WD651_10085 [Acidimicrobiia bacterium]
MNKTSRIATLGLTAVLVLAPVVIVQASDHGGAPDHVLQAAREAVNISRGLALEFAALAASGSGGTGVSEHAQGKPGHATGLARAREAIWLADGRGNGNGHAFGRGHATEVHAQLLAGGSPSALPNHGAKVRALVAAFNSLKADSGP